MSPIASAAPATRAALVVAAGLAILALVGVIAALVALVGLGQLRSDLDLARIPAWFWYYRADPEVRRWLAIGAGVGALLLLIIIFLAVMARGGPWTAPPAGPRPVSSAPPGFAPARTSCWAAPAASC